VHRAISAFPVPQRASMSRKIGAGMAAQHLGRLAGEYYHNEATGIPSGGRSRTH